MDWKFLGFHTSPQLADRVEALQKRLTEVRPELARVSKAEALRLIMVAGLDHYEKLLNEKE